MRQALMLIGKAKVYLMNFEWIEVTSFAVCMSIHMGQDLPFSYSFFKTIKTRKKKIRLN